MWLYYLNGFKWCLCIDAEALTIFEVQSVGQTDERTCILHKSNIIIICVALLNCLKRLNCLHMVIDIY